MALSLAQAQQRVRLAEDELYRIEQADDLAHVTGAYARAASCVQQARADLILAEQMARLCPRTPASLHAEIARTLNMEIG